MQTLRDIDVSHKTVFLRADLNVPLNNDGSIASDFKLQRILPTIDYLLAHDARIIMGTHLGRPQPAEGISALNKHLSTELLLPWFEKEHLDIGFASDPTNVRPKHAITLLENLRFFAGEKSHSKAFAKELAVVADVYVNDAFALIHQFDSSVALLPRQFAPESRAFGLLFAKEIATLTRLKHAPKQPFTVVLGGKKVREKIPLIKQLLLRPKDTRPHALLLGGCIASTFLHAQGVEVGNSLIDAEAVGVAREIAQLAQQQSVAIKLPKDAVLSFEDGSTQLLPVGHFMPKGTIIDIGPETIAAYAAKIEQARTIFFNGTMGIVEQELGEDGTRHILAAMTQSPAYTVVGGGDAVHATHTFGFEKKIDFLSTGGGATLAFLAIEDERELPAFQAML